MALRFLASYFSIALCFLHLAAAAAEPVDRVDWALWENRVETLREQEGVAPDLLQAVDGWWSRVRKELEEKENWQEKFREWNRQAEAIPAQRAALEKERKKITAETSQPIHDEAQALSSGIAETESQLEQTRLKKEEGEQEKLRRLKRLQIIPDRLLELEASRQEVSDQWGRYEGVKRLDSEQSRMALEAAARWQALTAEKNSLEAERTYYERHRDVLALQVEVLAEKIDKGQRKLALLQEQWTRAGQSEAIQDVEEAEKLVSRAELTSFPILLREAQTALRLADRRVGKSSLIAKWEETTEAREGVMADLEDVQGDYRVARKMVNRTGLTHAIGLLLRKKRQELVDIRRHSLNVKSRRVEISNAELMLMEFENQRAELENTERVTRKLMEKRTTALSGEKRKEWEQLAREIIRFQKRLLEKIGEDADRYFHGLVSLDTAEQQLIQESRLFGRFIDQRILWIRSTHLFQWRDIQRLGESLLWLIRPGQYRHLLLELYQDAGRNALAFLGLAVTLVLWMRSRQHCLQAIWVSGEKAEIRSPDDHFWKSLQTLAYSFWLALPGPLTAAWLAWRIADLPTPTTFTVALSKALASTALAWHLINGVGRICQKGGLADVHFRWRLASLDKIRAVLASYRLLVLPLSFFTILYLNQDRISLQDSMGRLLFMAWMAAVAVLALRLVHPRRFVLWNLVAENRRWWLMRVRWFWISLAVVAPILFMVLAFMGYAYTAQELFWRLRTSWVLLGVALLLFALAIRWAALARRKLALREYARGRSASNQENRKGVPGEEGVEVETQDKVDFNKVNIQTRKLIQSLAILILVVGGWLIWAPMIPALNVLENVELWPNTVTISETVEKPDGTTEVEERVINRPITLARVLWAVAIVAITVLAARNLPGLLEITILSLLELEKGGRYTVTTLARYCIVGAGAVVAFTMMGVGWSKIQWLVAAVSVGLGFGLQEIFANFVSGLIILFERPIRVGDTVTLGDVTGTVSKIHMRATTVIDWDRKELVVPNKEFITGRLVNWSLSDTILRLVLPVGIAYGSNVELAKKTLLQVARDNPKVLDEPEPNVIFMDFGDSSLVMHLRAFIPESQYIFSLRDELNTAIDVAFRKAKIEIAFPQRDIHVRSIQAVLPTRQEQADKQNPDS